MHLSCQHQTVVNNDSLIGLPFVHFSSCPSHLHPFLSQTSYLHLFLFIHTLTFIYFSFTRPSDLHSSLRLPGGGVAEGGCQHLIGQPRARGAHLHHTQGHRSEAELNLHRADPRCKCRRYTGNNNNNKIQHFYSQSALWHCMSPISRIIKVHTFW